MCYFESRSKDKYRSSPVRAPSRSTSIRKSAAVKSEASIAPSRQSLFLSLASILDSKLQQEPLACIGRGAAEAQVRTVSLMLQSLTTKIEHLSGNNEKGYQGRASSFLISCRVIGHVVLCVVSCYVGLLIVPLLISRGIRKLGSFGHGQQPEHLSAPSAAQPLHKHPCLRS